MGGGCGKDPTPLITTLLCLLILFCVAQAGVSKTLVAGRYRHERGSGRHHHQNYLQFIQSVSQSGSVSSNSGNNNMPAESIDDSEEPVIMTPKGTLVNTRVGQSAIFTCVVKNLGNRQVSWIRGRDLHVLSSGQVTFSSDARISVSHYEDSWTLTIKFTQPRDAGPYSCQVNTQPLLAVWYNLTVIEARANILGKKTLYVQSSSTVSLECVIKEQLVIPGLVLWYQDDRLVERHSERVRVNTTVGNVTTSVLRVEEAQLKDSGNYSCWPSAGSPDSVLVHVIQGDPPAAMQHGNLAPGASPFLLVPMILLTSLMFLLT